MDGKDSPTQLLIEALEQFGQAEPSHVLVIFLSDDGNIHYKSNFDGTCMKLGMIDTVKEIVLRRAFQRED